jgi:RNA polymerase sigma factor (TIGR02999 family)
MRADLSPGEISYNGRNQLMAFSSTLTQQLRLFMEGDSGAADSILREVLPKLHAIAARELGRERYMAPVSKTELIHELWIHNLSKGGWKINDQGHFYALASLAMRRILVDMARKRLTDRRGGTDGAVPLEYADGLGTSAEEAQQIVEIGIMMEQLEARDPDAARIVDMHYFSGFTLEEVATETGLSFRQVRLRWERGNRWLKRMLRRGSVSPTLFPGRPRPLQDP